MRIPRLDNYKAGAFLLALCFQGCRGPHLEQLDLGGVLPTEANSRTSDAGAPEVDKINFKDLAMPGFESLELSPDTANDVMAKIGGIEIRKHHIVDRLAEIDPAEVQRVLELLIIDQRVKGLAKEHAIFVPDEELRMAEGRDWARFRRLYRKRGGKVGEEELYLLRNHGLSMKQYRERNKKLAWRLLLRAYTLRYVHLKRGSLELLYLAGATRETAQACRNRIRLGADFATLCKRFSIDPSSVVGGKLPRIPGDYVHPAATLAKEIEVGECSRVREIELSPGKKAFAFVKVLSRTAADKRPFKDVWREIRDGLERRGIDAAELRLFISGG